MVVGPINWAPRSVRASVVQINDSKKTERILDLMVLENLVLALSSGMTFGTA
jgi:hypothetical protein